ncbi:DUF333 domain-containing protein [Rosenbergiella collisarenosi]|uniref:putative hemolysin n=1 Tax=Rosenbergiella collisarenosi TaxID=1544695 RepID=UPI0008F845B8
MNQRTLFKAVAGLTLMTALTACTQSPHKEASERQIGMANPASVYCLAQKGQLDNVSTAQGISSYCTLPSGERVEEWALFHRDHPNR